MEKMLPLRMNALWFTYIAVFSFALLPNFNIELNLLQITGASISGVFLVNLGAFYNEKPIMDERKQDLATEAMAWGFVTTSLILITSGLTDIQVTQHLMRDTAEMGLWTWLIAFSVKNLYQRYGDSE
jgi:uncharacterized membrane protein YhaH (DUF805 family)